jgi:hypothetical protein
LSIALSSGIVRLFRGLDRIRGFTTLPGLNHVFGQNRPVRREDPSDFRDSQ